MPISETPLVEDQSLKKQREDITFFTDSLAGTGSGW